MAGPTTPRAHWSSQRMRHGDWSPTMLIHSPATCVGRRGPAWDAAPATLSYVPSWRVPVILGTPLLPQPLPTPGRGEDSVGEPHLPAVTSKSLQLGVNFCLSVDFPLSIQCVCVVRQGVPLCASTWKYLLCGNSRCNCPFGKYLLCTRSVVFLWGYTSCNRSEVLLWGIPDLMSQQHSGECLLQQDSSTLVWNTCCNKSFMTCGITS